MSIVVVWANDQVSKYNQWLSDALDEIQVKHGDDDVVLKECMSIVEENAAMLKDEGVELPIVRTIENHQSTTTFQ